MVGAGVCVAVGALVDVAVGTGVAVGGIGVDVAAVVAVGAFAVASRLTLVACARAMSTVACASGGVSVCALATTGMATINMLINVATMHLMICYCPPAITASSACVKSRAQLRSISASP